MNNEPSVSDLVKLLQKLPPPKPLPDHAITREEILLASDQVECSCLQKFISMSETRHINTGVIDALDTTCKDCLKDVHDMSIVVCCRCRRVVSRFTPHRDPTTGFEFKKSHVYHVESCPRCEPGKLESIIIEKYIYEAERN